MVLHAYPNSTYTFWRFLIQVPLERTEMIVKYTINKGQPLEFYVPARRQEMRWATYSVRRLDYGMLSH